MIHKFPYEVSFLAFPLEEGVYLGQLDLAIKSTDHKHKQLNLRTPFLSEDGSLALLTSQQGGELSALPLNWGINSVRSTRWRFSDQGANNVLELGTPKNKIGDSLPHALRDLMAHWDACRYIENAQVLEYDHLDPKQKFRRVINQC